MSSVKLPIQAMIYRKNCLVSNRIAQKDIGLCIR